MLITKENFTQWVEPAGVRVVNRGKWRLIHDGSEWGWNQMESVGPFRIVDTFNFQLMGVVCKRGVFDSEETARLWMAWRLLNVS